MKALTLHQAMSAITAIENPEMVSARFSAVNSSAKRGRAAPAAAVSRQRSGSRTNRRTTKATAAGMRPHRKTNRQEVSGDPLKKTPAIWKLAKVARNSPKGAEV